MTKIENVAVFHKIMHWYNASWVEITMDLNNFDQVILKFILTNKQEKKNESSRFSLITVKANYKVTAIIRV